MVLSVNASIPWLSVWYDPNCFFWKEVRKATPDRRCSNDPPVNHLLSLNTAEQRADELETLKW